MITTARLSIVNIRKQIHDLIFLSILERDRIRIEKPQFNSIYDFEGVIDQRKFKNNLFNNQNLIENNVSKIYNDDIDNQRIGLVTSIGFKIKFFDSRRNLKLSSHLNQNDPVVFIARMGLAIIV